MEHKEEDQSIKAEDKQTIVDVDKTQQDDFKPEKTAEEYAKMWREASAEAKAERKGKAEYKSRLEAQEKLELEKQGKYKEMWQKDKAELEALKTAAISGAKKAYLKDKLVEQGLNPAYADKALRLADLDSIEVDRDTLRPDMEQISYEANKLKEELPMLFGKKFTTPKDGVPGSTKVDAKNIKDMTDKELDSLYMEAMKDL